MIRFTVLTILALAIAIGGGAGSVWMMLQSEERFDAVSIGHWTAHPDRGTTAANPYSRAAFARQPQLALGTAEGIVFETREDSAGRTLRAACSYRLSGPFPAARFWTLHARWLDGSLAETAKSNRMPALHSRSLLRNEDGSASIAVSSRPASGNWLAIGDNGPFELILTLYDAAITSSSSLSDLEMPALELTACHG